jgi:predicted nucleic acid binding AN1-type Zn finger protein
MTPPISPVASGTSSQAAPTQAAQRCPCCRKKLGLLDLACRCGTRFCGVHRLPEAHACKHDYRADAQKQLAKQLERVTGDKVTRI